MIENFNRYRTDEGLWDYYQATMHGNVMTFGLEQTYKSDGPKAVRMDYTFGKKDYSGFTVTKLFDSRKVHIKGALLQMGGIPLDQFSPMHMELLINALLDRGGQKTKELTDGRPLSPKTVRHIASVDGNKLIFCRPQVEYYNPALGTRVCSHASELLSNGVLIPTVAKRLGTCEREHPLSIYAYALDEADELAVASSWNDLRADVLAPKKQLSKRNPARRLAKTGSD